MKIENDQTHSRAVIFDLEIFQEMREQCLAGYRDNWWKVPCASQCATLRCGKGIDKLSL